MNNPKLSLPELVESLSYEELYRLNHLVVDRLRLLSKAKALMNMQKFNIFDRVSFGIGADKKTGIVVRINQRTLTISTEDSHFYRVPPEFVSKIAKENQNESEILQIFGISPQEQQKTGAHSGKTLNRKEQAAKKKKRKRGKR